MKRILSVIIIIIILLLAVYSVQSKKGIKPAAEKGKPATVQDSAPSEVEIKSPFDARKVKVGDKVLGLKITNIKLENDWEEDYDAYVDFEGEVTVSGTYKHNKDDVFLDHEISFSVDDATAAKLPRLAHDQRYVWFMFLNHDEAEKLFGPPGSEGNAEVTIKNYSINYAHTEVWDTAYLVKVEKK